ncbi:MAG: hypothetical protein IKT08_08550 [Bacteroidales bacterium]|nr:hypothetical protein [Bacteroidales bacterium]
MKQKTYSMIVGNSQLNDNCLNLVSNYGQCSVRFSINHNGLANDFVVDLKDDLVRIIEFLQQRCNAEEAVLTNTPSYTATGVGLCVFDSSGKVLETYYGQSDKGIVGYVRDWDYELLQQLFPHPNAVYALFDLYDGSVSRNLLIRVIQVCVSLQARFVATGVPAHCRKMGLQDVADKAGCDITLVSRATQNVRIITQHKDFTLDNNVTSLENPSLFDAGCFQYGLPVSRLEVVEIIKNMINGENPTKPLSDLAISCDLLAMGYQVERRTVDKYRGEILGIPNSNQRRRRK